MAYLNQDGQVSLRNLKTGQERVFQESPDKAFSTFSGVAFSDDGRWMIWNQAGWDANNDRVVELDAAVPLAVSPSGDRLINNQGIWSLQGNRLLLPLGNEHRSAAYAWSPDGKLIARYILVDHRISLQVLYAP